MLNLNFKKSLLIFSLALLALFPLASDASTLTLSPTSASRTINQTIAVTINLNTAGVGVSGVDIRDLTFNQSVLRADSVVSGGLFLVTQANTIDNNTGRITFQQVAQTGSSYNGSATLATVNFTVIGAGTANLSFDFVSGSTTDTNVSGPGPNDSIIDTLTSVSGATITSSTGDTTIPTISDIGVNNITTTSANVFWTTSENTTGVVRYGTTISYGSTATDSSLGTSNSVTLTGLSPNTTYNYDIRAQDAAQNFSAYSLNRTFTTTSPPDTQGPNAVSNLTASNVGQNSATFSWTAPSDIPSGNVSSYHIRYSTAPITTANWSSALQAEGEPNPSTPGTPEGYTLINLTQGTTYYVALRSQDGLNNISPLSNLVTIQTQTPAPAPAVTLLANGTANNITIPYNTSATLSWNASDATSCTSSGAWGSSSRPTNSSASTGNLTTSQTYTISCTGAGGTAVSTVVVNVSAPAAATLGLTATGGVTNITLPASNSGTTLTWITTNATTCTASGGTGSWAGSRPVNSTFSTGSLTASQSYTLTCSGANPQQVVRTVDVQVSSPLPAPTVDFSINGESETLSVVSGSSLNLVWTSNGASGCGALGSWFGTKVPNGNETINNVTTSGTYTFLCSNANGSVHRSVEVNVTQPDPVVSLRVNGNVGPVSVTTGSSVTLSWTSSNATSCTASGGWSGGKALNSSETISNITQGTSFILSCTGSGGSQGDSVVANIQTAGSGSTGPNAGVNVPDTTPPNAPDSLLVLGVSDGIRLQWRNPTASDYVRTLVVRKEGSAPANRTDGTVVYDGVTPRYSDTTALAGRTYHYALFAFDTSSNYSNPARGSSSLGAYTEAQAQLQLTGQTGTSATPPTNPTTPCVPTSSGSTGLSLARGLVQGSRGEDVRQLQRFLNANGFTVASSGTGSSGMESTYFGPATTAAVKRFQCSRGVTCSGVGYGNVGPLTRAALAQGGATSCVTPPTTPSTPTTPGSVKITITRPLYLGAAGGEDVRQLQRFLNAKGFTIASSGAGSPENETTFFGRATQRAVQRYQCARGIVCAGQAGYGSVGPKTRAQINGE